MVISESAKAARRQHLVDCAHALIRETGAGFSMTQLAERAGVSPATPYNLLGSKSGVLRGVVRDEFARFAARLDGLPPDSTGLARLLAAIDLVVIHYSDEREFCHGLYQAALGTEVRSMMSEAGQDLWRGLVAAALDRGDLDPLLSAEGLTAILLRMVAATTQAWLAEGWAAQRFSVEMTRATGLLLLGLAPAATQPVLRARLHTAGTVA